MAVTTQLSDQYKLRFSTTESELGAVYPSEVNAFKKAEFFTHTQSGAGDATSSVALCKLPAGRCRLLMPESWIQFGWDTASATVDLGWDAYTGADNASVAADPDGILNGLAIDTEDLYGFEEFTASLGTGITAAGGFSRLFESRDGVVIRATSQDVALADADYLAGCLTYLYG